MNDMTHAGDLLLDAWLNLTSVLWNTRVVTSLTYNEAHVMGLLLRHGEDGHPMTATDLITQTRLLKSQMNKILTTLEKQGYVTRMRAELDRRLIHIRLTAAGKAAYLREHSSVEHLLRQLIERIGIERALAVSRELTDITRALDDIIAAPKQMPSPSQV